MFYRCCWALESIDRRYLWYNRWLQCQFGRLRATVKGCFSVIDNIICTVARRNISSLSVFPRNIGCTSKSGNITWYRLIFISCYTSVMWSYSWKDRSVSVILINCNIFDLIVMCTFVLLAVHDHTVFCIFLFITDNFTFFLFGHWRVNLKLWSVSTYGPLVCHIWTVFGSYCLRGDSF